MKRDEAELISYWCQFFAGGRPAPVRKLAAVGPEGAAALAHGLSRVAIRYLLGQGGAHPDVSLVGDQRDNQRVLWSRPFVALDFRKPLLEWLARMASGRSTEPGAAQPLGAGGEVILLMVADELAQRPRADLPLSTVTRRGALAWLAHGGADAPTFPGEPAVDDVLFFARGRVARAWQALDPASDGAGSRHGLTAMLERADQRALAWRWLRDRVTASKRYDLLAPMCAAATILWRGLDADRLVARVEALGRFPGESPRQEAYGRLLAAYAWLGELETWADEARRTGRFDDGFDRWQVFLAYYQRIPESARLQSGRLLAQLRRTL